MVHGNELHICGDNENFAMGVIFAVTRQVEFTREHILDGGGGREGMVEVKEGGILTI